MAAQRILNRAAVLLTEGMDPIDAIEQACEDIGTTPNVKELARNTFMALAARIERGQ